MELNKEEKKWVNKLGERKLQREYGKTYFDFFLPFSVLFSSMDLDLA